MDALHRQEAGAVEAHLEIAKTLPRDSVQKTMRAATSPRSSTSVAFTFGDERKPAHFLPLMGAPFLGMNRDTGGVIFCTTEKFRWFSAKPMRPRES